MHQSHLDRTFDVRTADCDSRMHLKPYSLLCAAQDLANDHASSLHFGYDDLIESRCAWVLSRIRVQFLQDVNWREKIVLRTWHKGISGIFALRDFSAFRPEAPESELIRITTSWLIINLDTRRMQRADRLIGEHLLSTAWDRNAIAEPCERIPVPDTLEAAGSHRVLFSDIDFNRHTNNAKYIEWGMDALEDSLLLNRRIREFQINFNAESRLGDEVSLFRNRSEDGNRYVEGRIADKNIFQLQIKFD